MSSKEVEGADYTMIGDDNNDNERSPLVKEKDTSTQNSPPNVTGEKVKRGSCDGAGQLNDSLTNYFNERENKEAIGANDELQLVEETALAGGVVEQINYLSVDHFGLFLQYFCVGICYSCSISVNYEFFTSYMGQSGDFFNVAMSAISLPWSFKIVYGAVNDCLPILGYRRKPYMVMGWAGCAIVGLALSLQKLPGSRFEHDPVAIASGNCSEHGELKPNSKQEYQNESLKFMSMLTLFNVFLVLTDVAMDGLMVQYARKESLKRRGRAQTFVYAIRAIGMACGALLKGFGLNWYEYSGPWCKGISISDIFGVVAVTSLVAIPVILFMTTEDRVRDEKSATHIVNKMWILLQNTAVQKVLVFQMGSAILLAVASPADPMIQLYWLSVDNLTKNILVGVLGQITFCLGATAFAKYLIDYNWKMIFGSTAVIVVLMNWSLTYIVIYDVFRNQYFYLSDEFTQMFFGGVNNICGLVLFIELSESDTEGISYALMTTAYNASLTVGALIGNFVVYFFYVSDPDKFNRDSIRDRNLVAGNYAVIYLVNLSMLLFLPLLPRGKKETQELKNRARSSKLGGIVLGVTVCSFIIFSVLYSFVLYRYIG